MRLKGGRLVENLSRKQLDSQVLSPALHSAMILEVYSLKRIKHRCLDCGTLVLGWGPAAGRHILVTTRELFKSWSPPSSPTWLPNTVGKAENMIANRFWVLYLKTWPKKKNVLAPCLKNMGKGPIRLGNHLPESGAYPWNTPIWPKWERCYDWPS